MPYYHDTGVKCFNYSPRLYFEFYMFINSHTNFRDRHYYDHCPSQKFCQSYTTDWFSEDSNPVLLLVYVLFSQKKKMDQTRNVRDNLYFEPQSLILVAFTTRLKQYLTVVTGFLPLKDTGKVHLFREVRSKPNV